jgi:signal transduction histidine kinase
MRLRSLRMQLTLLYAVLCFGCAVIVAALPLLAVRSTQEVGSTAAPVTTHPEIQLYHQVPFAIVLPVMAVLSVVFGALIAGRPVRVVKTAFTAQRHFVANAAHELRTPLTAERTVLQVALANPEASAGELRSACEEVLRLGDQQARLIDSLLTLASSERGIERAEQFDLAVLAGEVVAARGGRDVRVDTVLGPAPVSGNPRLVESLVANLVDNALRYNEPGGWVSVETGVTGKHPVLRVRNSGPVVPRSSVASLLEPFRRLDGESRGRSAEGHGLGLAIVAAIARAHDADLAVRARPEGGLDITVTFRS